MSLGQKQRKLVPMVAKLIGPGLLITIVIS